MGLIREPDGVDFIIQSEPLSMEQEVAISEFIRNYKLQMQKKSQAITPIRRKRVIA